MIARTAAVLGRRSPLVIKVPVLTPRLSSYWVALVTPVEVGLVRPLVDGLKSEMVVESPPGGRDQRRPHGLRRRGAGRAGVKLLNRREVRRIADAVIRDPEEHTTFGADGAVRSIQAADLTLPEAELDGDLVTRCTSSGSRARTGSTSRASRSGSSASATRRRSARSC